MAISRRKVLLGALYALGVASTYGVFKWLTADPEDIVEVIVKRRVGYLGFYDEDVENFARAYVRERPEHAKKLKQLSIFSDPLRFYSPYEHLHFRHPFRRLEDSVVSLFLLSTDFFHHDVNQNRVIHYLGFYNPLASACRNPLMRPRA